MQYLNNNFIDWPGVDCITDVIDPMIGPGLDWTDLNEGLWGVGFLHIDLGCDNNNNISYITKLYNYYNRDPQRHISTVPMKEK